MRTAFYWKFAFNGISKNKKTYFPYIFSSAVMVMMQYIICFLSWDSEISMIKGGVQMQTILSMGIPVVSIFSLIFLFYTNSFLIRRRKKEFGLYNILGMAKRNIAKVLFCESVTVAGVSIAGGIACGILFSKLTQLLMAYSLNANVSFNMNINLNPIPFLLVAFLIIFTLVYLNTLRQVHMTSPVELLKSEASGEKPPKSNPIIAILGALFLGAGYYIAQTMQDPMAAIAFFFLAVILVIFGTYLLFVSGSVFVCKLLKANKKYYYNKRNFISVSSMVYRMKRNGAGLASICILSTAVLVMLSSTSCLMIGGNDMFMKRYPREFVVDADVKSHETGDSLSKAVSDITEKTGGAALNTIKYDYVDLSAILDDDTIKLPINETIFNAGGSPLSILVISIDDYNTVNGFNETLNDDEIILCPTKIDYNKSQLDLNGYKVNIKKTVEEGLPNGITAMQVFPVFYVFTNDVDAFVENIYTKNPQDKPEFINSFYGFDLEGDEESDAAFYKTFSGNLSKSISEFGIKRFSFGYREESKASYFSLYKGLFFLAILLGIICVGATVLIMYYKQITEGYEDKSRFDIMQKVGMTKKEIAKSVNSQVLTVFFAPLIGAGVHILAAFHIIWLLLTAFGLTNSTTLGWISVGCYILFALFYAVVYFITSRSYYSIVSRQG